MPPDRDDIDDQEFFGQAIDDLEREVDLTTAIHGRQGLGKLNTDSLHCIFWI